MPDVMSLFDSDFLHAWDLPPNRDVTVTIEECIGGELTGEKGRKSRKPVLKFKGKAKKLALNKTNTNAIIKQHGRDYAKWSGKLITLYATDTTFGKDKVPCIRVKPKALSSTPSDFPDRPVDDRAREMATSQAQAAGRVERDPGSDDR